MTTLTSECYDGTSIVSTLTTDKDGRPVVNIEWHRSDAAGEAFLTEDTPVPPNAANPEDWLAFEHREAWRDYNERKLPTC